MTDIYDMPGHLIRRMQQLSVSVFANGIKKLGVDLTSPQFAALVVLHKHPGIDQATLGGLIAHDRPTIGGVISRMIDKGLVERKVSDMDRRAKLLKLTDSGEEMLKKLRPEVAKMQSDILPGLTNEERDQFIRLSKKIAEAGNDMTGAPFIPFEAGKTD